MAKISWSQYKLFSQNTYLAFGPFFHFMKSYFLMLNFSNFIYQTFCLEMKAGLISAIGVTKLTRQITFREDTRAASLLWKKSDRTFVTWRHFRLKGFNLRVTYARLLPLRSTSMSLKKCHLQGIPRRFFSQ